MCLIRTTKVFYCMRTTIVPKEVEISDQDYRLCLKVGRERRDACSGMWSWECKIGDVGTSNRGCRDIKKNSFHSICVGNSLIRNFASLQLKKRLGVEIASLM